jgi:hypothetical protein
MTDFTIKQKLRELLSNYEGLRCKVCLSDDELVLLDGRVTTLENDVLLIQSDITTIEGDIVTINSDIADLVIDIDAIEIDVADHEARITALEGAPAGGTTINLAANYAALPDPTTVSGEFYYVQAASGTAWLPGTLGGTYRKAGLYYSNGVAWLVDVNPWEASQADVDAGVITDEFVSPATLSLATTVSHPGHTHVIADITDYTGTSASVISPAQITSDQDNYNPTGFLTSTVVRLSGDNGIRAITGFAAGTDGQRVTLSNVGSFPLYYPPSHPDSSSGNQTLYYKDFIHFPNTTVDLIYDDTGNGWRILGEDNREERAGIYYKWMPGESSLATHNELSFGGFSSGTHSATAATTALPACFQISSAGSSTAGFLLNFARGAGSITAFGSSHLWVEAWVSIPTLSTVTERFTLEIQFTNNHNSGSLENNNSVNLRYSDNINGGEWELFSQDNAGAESTADTNIPVVAATLYKVRIEMDKSKTEARAYINGAFVGRVTGSMPNSVVCSPNIIFLKSIGTTARQFNLHNFSAGAIYP